MYDLTLSQNDHFNQKNKLEKPYFSCPMLLIKMNILLINVNTLVKLTFWKTMISYSGNLEAKLFLLSPMESEPYILNISSYSPSTLSNIVDVHVLASA